jgi:hypothetical protein
MKTRKTPQSGKLGNVVSFKNRYGQVDRTLTIPANRGTAFQQRARSDFGRFSAHWRRLTEEQRQAWIAFARRVSSRPRMGQSGPLTGLACFVKVNCNLASISLPMVVSPPDRPRLGVNPVGALMADRTDGEVVLKLKVAGTPAHDIIVLAAAPCSAGVSYVDHFTVLGLLPAPVAGYSNITALYVAKYGVPPAESKVFIRTVQQVDGWRDLPKQTFAIVPPA